MLCLNQRVNLTFMCLLFAKNSSFIIAKHLHAFHVQPLIRLSVCNQPNATIAKF